MSTLHPLGKETCNLNVPWPWRGEKVTSIGQHRFHGTGLLFANEENNVHSEDHTAYFRQNGQVEEHGANQK